MKKSAAHRSVAITCPRSRFYPKPSVTSSTRPIHFSLASGRPRSPIFNLPFLVSLPTYLANRCDDVFPSNGFSKKYGGSRTPVPQVLSISQSQCKNRRLGPVTASNASYLYAAVSPGNRAQLCGMETTSVPSCVAAKTDCRGIRITDGRRSWIRESGSFQHIVQTIP
jgi:hypothetical protein